MHKSNIEMIINKSNNYVLQLNLHSEPTFRAATKNRKFRDFKPLQASRLQTGDLDGTK